MTEQTYWVNEQDDIFSKKFIDKKQHYYDEFRTSAFYQALRKSWKLYNNIKGNAYSAEKGLQQTGDQGQYTIAPINNFKALLKTLLILVTGNSPTFKSSPSNDDAKSVDQSRLAEDIITYYVAEKGLEDLFVQMAEYAIALGEGYIKVTWDTSAGEEYDIDIKEDTEEAKEIEEANTIYEGDLDYSVISPLDIVFDRNIVDWKKQKWCAVRSYENKWDLAAQFPDLADEILKVAPDDSATLTIDTEFRGYINSVRLRENADLIPVWEFFHIKSNAVPEGRYVKMAGETILIDMPLPYCELPVKQMTGGRMILTGYGYTSAFDLIAPQEVLDAAFSTIVTQLKRDAIANWWIGGGDSVDVENLAGGGRLLKTKGTVPPQLMDTNVNLLQYYEVAKVSNQMSELMSGINSITRGSIDAKLSGTALALVDSKSIQFASDVTRNYYRALEEIATFSVRVLRDFSTTQRVVNIVGQDKRGVTEVSFTGDQLQNFTRFHLTSQNPLFRTTGGKMEIADKLLSVFGPTNGIQPQEYIKLVETGQLDPLYERGMAELVTIQRENEALRRGKDVMAQRYDNHPLHIPEHEKLMNDPIVRNNPELMNFIAAHNIHHRKVWDFLSVTEPQVLQAMGIQPSIAANMTPPPEMGEVPQGNTAAVTEMTRPVNEAPEIEVRPAKLPESPVPPVVA